MGESLKVIARKDDGTPGMSFTPTVLEVDPGRLLRWKGKLLVAGIFDGEHIFELLDLGNGRTRLVHSENFGGVLIPLMGKVLTETEAGFVDFNEALVSEVATRRQADCQS